MPSKQPTTDALCAELLAKLGLPTSPSNCMVEIFMGGAVASFGSSFRGHDGGTPTKSALLSLARVLRTRGINFVVYLVRRTRLLLTC